jgi:hypothetical protein
MARPPPGLTSRELRPRAPGRTGGKKEGQVAESTA